MDPADSASASAPQSWNKYSFVLNNPAKLVDPDGEHPILIIAGGIALGGVLLGPSAANAPESQNTELIASHDLPLDVMLFESIGGAFGHLAGKFATTVLRKLKNAKNIKPEAVEVSKITRPLKGKDPAKGLRKQLAAHEQKLKNFKENPEAFDNKGFLKNAPSQEIRERIIRTRIDNLERQIENSKKQIRDISDGAID